MERSRSVTMTASEARASFSDLLDQAQQGEVVIARHGKPIATVIGADRYEALREAFEALEDALLAERAQARLDRIDAGDEPMLTFDEVFGEPQ